MGNINVDTCIVGAGPAGLALALRMAANGADVMQVDGGGEGADSKGADLHGGTISEAVHAADRTDDTLVGGSIHAKDHLEHTRWRQPGGTAWRWSAKGRPGALDTVRMVQGMPCDFEARPEFDIPGFPFEPDEILRHRDDALEFLGLGGHSFDPTAYDDGRRPAPLPDSFYAKLFHFPQATTLRHRRPDEAMAHPLIDVRRGWHLRELVRAGDRLVELRFVDVDGRERRVRPNRTVLALGGVENSRQLLIGSQSGAIPDPHDQLGRYFFDHPHIRLGYLLDADVDALDYYDFQEIDETFVLRGHGITPEVAQAEGLLRFSIDVVGRHAFDATSAGFGLAQVLDGLRRRSPAAIARGAVTAARHPIGAAQLARYASQGRVHHTGIGGWSDTENRLLPVGVASVESMFEQRPSPDNRIRLGSQTDRYGQPLPTLQWSFSEIEVDSIRRAVEVTSAAFEHAGLGRLTTMKELGDGAIPRAGTGLHHMGGTRMHVDPAEGVVDGDGRFHHLENLHLTGSSVFPTTIGFANPTFTVIQTAMRLADHLAGVDAASPDVVAQRT